MEAIKLMQRYYQDKIETATIEIAKCEKALASLALEALGRDA